jgi:hypothetical protein
MQIVAETFWLPKHGNTPAEYEDAFFPKKKFNQDVKLFRTAIADGATETSFSKEWANLLVQKCCMINDKKQFIQDLPELQTQWYAEVKNKDLPWYAQEKFYIGAYSTILALKLEENTYDVMAIGDTCLFHIRGEQLENCFPLTDSKQFNDRPVLLSSYANNNEGILKNILGKSGLKWQQGDEFYLMTDALACWFLEAYEKKSRPWAKIRALKPGNFKNFIAKLRSSKALHNDDVTLVRVITK